MRTQNTEQFDNITLHDAIKNDNIDFIQTLIDNGADIEEIDSNSCTPLICSIICKNDRAAELLIRNGANVNGGIKQNSLIPLHCAVWHRSVTILQMLIRAGVNVDALQYEPDLLGINQPQHGALHIAAQLGYNDVMNLLLKAGADVNIRDMFGMDALCISAQHIHTECLKTCLNHGAIVNTQNEANETPLQIAVEYDNLQISQMCIDAGSVMNGRDKCLAHYALYRDRIAMFALLVKAGIDLNTVDSDGRGIISKCIRQGKKECIQILVDDGADVNCSVDRFGNNALNTVLDVQLEHYYNHFIYLRFSNQVDCVHPPFAEVIDYLNILINAGARVNQQNDMHQTLLLRYLQTLKTFKVHLFKTNVLRSSDGQELVQYALQSYPIVQYMLNNGYDPDLQDYSGSGFLNYLLKLD